MPKYTDADLLPVLDHVRAMAAPRGRVFRRPHLVEWGVPPDTVVPMLRRGYWVRLHHGVYADTRDVDSDASGADRHRLLLAASICALVEPAYAFGPSAALLHGIAMPRGLLSDIHLVRSRGAEGRSLTRRITASDHLPGAVMRTCPLDEADLTSVDGIPSVGPELAAVSTATLCSADWAVAVLDSAAWEAPGRIGTMEAHAQSLQHLAGIGTVRACIDLVRPGAQTPLESLSRVRLVRAGLPEPALQVSFSDHRGLIGRVDMFFPDLGVIGEADGRLKYLTGDDLIAEKVREDRLRALHPVVRWDWEAIWSDPKEIAAQIRRASQRRRAG